jgi:DNA polymerase III delta subunit
VSDVDIISSTEFLKRIKENADGNYLFYGEEDYLKAHALKSFKDAMGLDEALEIFNLVKIDVLDYDAEKLIDALSMPPMMAEKKLVVVSGLNIKKMSRGGKSDEGDNSVGELRALIDAIKHLEEFDYNNLIIIIPAGNITEDEPKKKLPVEEFMKRQGRFAHCFKPGNEWTLEAAQEYVDAKWEELLNKCD